MKTFKKILKITLISLSLIILLSTLFFGYSDIPLNDLKAQYATAASRFITIDNMDVHYRDEGPKTDSIPLILIHGTGSSLHTFEGWTSQLKARKRIIRMDLPGYGLTGPFPDRDYQMAHYVSFINIFLDALHIEQCIIGGNSLGGGIAWRYTLAHPNKVQKLVLIDASGYPVAAKSKPLAFKLAQWPVIKNAFTYITPKFVARASVENVYANPDKVSDTLVDRYFQLTLRAGNRQAFVDRLAVEHQSELYKDIKTIMQPTLILWGEEDQLIPVEMAQNFHNDLPNNTLIVLKNLGHVPMEEAPKESLQPLLNFLDIEL